MGKKCFRRSAVKRIFVVCEGQTEASFVKRILVPYFDSRNKTLIPITIMTKQDKQRGKMYKGGMCNFEKARSTITKVLAGVKDRNTFVTTMFDFYRLPIDTPGMDKIKSINDPYKKIALLETEIQTFEKISSSIYFPYIQLHEFESLIFADIDKITEIYFEPSYDISQLKQALAKIHNPELINNGESTAPSKRILECIPEYDKIDGGITILEKIGIEKLQKECMHFSCWIDKLEQL